VPESIKAFTMGVIFSFTRASLGEDRDKKGMKNIGIAVDDVVVKVVIVHVSSVIKQIHK
jgi:hypothetical protein